MKYTQLWIVCLLALPILGQAAALSEPLVRSGLGQRFIAEVEIVDLEKSSWKSLNAVVASPSLYEEKGVEYSNAVSDMEVFVLHHRNGRPYLRVVGQHPINDAFVELILDVGWKDGRVVRKYTILPEPPAMDPQQQEGFDGSTLPEREERKERRFRQRKIDPADQVMGTAQLIRRTESGHEESAQVTISPSTAVAAGSQERMRVQAGDSLNRLAQRWQMPHLGMYQRMWALYRSNPHLFKGGNPDRLIRGRWMITPQHLDGIPETEVAAREDWLVLMQSPEAWKTSSLAEAEDSFSQSSARSHGRESDAADESNIDHRAVKGKWSDAAEDETAQVLSHRLKVSRGMSAKEIENYERLLAVENSIRELIKEVKGRSPTLTLSKELAPLPETPKPTELPISPINASQNKAVDGVPVVLPTKKKSTRHRLPSRPLPIEPVVEAAGFPWWLTGLSLVGLVGVIAGSLFLYRRYQARKSAVDSLLKDSAELAEASTIFTDTGQSIQQAVTAADLAGAGSLNRESLMNVDTDTQLDPLIEADVYISYERYEAAEALLRNALEQNIDSRDILWRLFLVSRAQGHEGEFKMLAARLHSMFEPNDPKQIVICEILGIAVPRPYFCVEEEVVIAEAEALKQSLVEEKPAEMAVSLEKESILEDNSSEGVLMMTMLELPLAKASVAKPSATPSYSSSMGMEMMSFDMPSLSMDLDFARITNAFESEQKELSIEVCEVEIEKIVSQDEHEIEDDLVQSQLELAKAWGVQGKIVAARALLEAIVQTGTRQQQQRARMMLDELSKDDAVDLS